MHLKLLVFHGEIDGCFNADCYHDGTRTRVNLFHIDCGVVGSGFDCCTKETVLLNAGPSSAAADTCERADTFNLDQLESMAFFHKL
ncbi:unnamed protein product [Protopolystoma xenopodis]|uniref:Uncharacterized protein n=1 Tax=Protopolystoma xenopodis TaxID=117903 RepID=A0A3S4ZEU4_9PLAT|nr:unnamed protein product [Protopolystoma xenopodis]